MNFTLFDWTEWFVKVRGDNSIVAYAVLTSRDKGSTGKRTDTSGDAIVEMMQDAGHALDERVVLPDDFNDLSEQIIKLGIKIISFEIDDFKKICLLDGLDDIALSLEKSDKISSYEKHIQKTKPWMN